MAQQLQEIYLHHTPKLIQFILRYRLLSWILGAVVQINTTGYVEILNLYNAQNIAWERQLEAAAELQHGNIWLILVAAIAA